MNIRNNKNIFFNYFLFKKVEFPQLNYTRAIVSQSITKIPLLAPGIFYISAIQRRKSINPPGLIVQRVYSLFDALVCEQVL